MVNLPDFEPTQIILGFVWLPENLHYKILWNEEIWKKGGDIFEIDQNLNIWGKYWNANSRLVLTSKSRQKK